MTTRLSAKRRADVFALGCQPSDQQVVIVTTTTVVIITVTTIIVVLVVVVFVVVPSHSPHLHLTSWMNALMDE